MDSSLLLITFLLLWGRNRVENGVEAIVLKLSANVDAASRNIIQSSFIVTVARTILRLILFGIFLSILNGYLSILFSAFAQTRHISKGLGAYVTAPIFEMLVKKGLLNVQTRTIKDGQNILLPR